MTAVDFGAWATPALPIALGGRTYSVRPPSVADAPRVLALAIRHELAVGLSRGKVPAEVQAILNEVEAASDHPSLGRAIFDEMIADGLDAVTIARAEMYATLYWARGREYADAVATLMWSPQDGLVDAAGKRSSRSRSGRRTTTPTSGSASRTTSTPTASRSTASTDPSPSPPSKRKPRRPARP